MAKSTNFSVIQGDSFVLNATYKDPQGQAIDLSTYDIYFVVKDQHGGKTTCSESSLKTINGERLSNGITETDGVSGQFRVEITPDQTKNFTFPKAAYQLQIVSESGTRSTLASGIFSVERGNI